MELLFARSLPEGSLEHWQPEDTEGHPSIQLRNRYFTNKRDQGSQPALSFSSEVDPKRILTNAANQGVVHLEDNLVKYYEASYPKPGKIK
jgi:hypothetical protein